MTLDSFRPRSVHGRRTLRLCLRVQVSQHPFGRWSQFAIPPFHRMASCGQSGFHILLIIDDTVPHPAE